MDKKDLRGMDKQDLRGIVTIVMLGIFFFCIFVPVAIRVAFGIELGIPEAYTQAVIQLTSIVVAFYFTNKATKDKIL